MTASPSASRTPLVNASIGLHVFVAGAVTMQPSWWPMGLATVFADHLLLVAAGLWPTGDWIGPNLRRLPAAAVARREVALTLDDGPDPEVTPRVLDRLDELGVHATFFCVGAAVLEHAALARDIVARGHAIENHSFHHHHRFSVLGPWGYQREITAAQHAIADTVGVEPRFFRAPAGLRNVFLQPVLARHGLVLTSWTRRGFDTLERNPYRVTKRLIDGLASGDILLLHDGNAARDREGEPVVLKALSKFVSGLRVLDLHPVTLAEAFR